MKIVYKKTLICLLLLVYYGLAHSQAIVTGVVRGSDDGKTLPAISVTVKDSTTGIATNIDGKLKITVVPKSCINIFFYKLHS